MRALLADLRSAIRALVARPLFTGTVVLTLGLGLGAATAIFAVVDAVLLRPLPYPADHELVALGERDASRNLTGTSLPAVDAWRELDELRALAFYEASPVLFTQGGAPERVPGAAVSPEFFATLGVGPALGVTFQPGEPRFDPAGRIVLSHELWQERFDADPGVLGRVLELEGTAYEVIGVMPAGFALPASARFWRSLPEAMSLLADAPGLRFVEVVGRLAPGATADAVLSRLGAWQSAQAVDEDDAGYQVFATPLRDVARGGVGPALTAVFAGVTLLLLVTCANVMALMLANGRARLDELSIRAALGASRARLVRQLLFEGTTLALAGAVLALLATRATRALVIALSADQIPRIEGFGVSPAVMAFAVLAGLGAALLVAAWPALSLARTAAGAPAARRVIGARRSRRLFGALVAVEFALALVLVAGAGLLAGSYRQLLAVDTGTAPDRVGVARLVLPLGADWRPNERRRQFFDALADRLRAVPGIERAAFVSRLPLDAARGGADLVARDQPGRTVRALQLMAGPDYFETVGARLVAGRAFDGSDREGAPPVVVLNALAAVRLFGSETAAVGQVIEYPYFTGPRTATVAGVVAPIRYDDLASDLRPEMYLPIGQGTIVPLALVYRAADDPRALVPSIREAVRDADPTGTVALDEVGTLDTRLSQVVARPRFFLVLSAVFAALALLLAACGIYGTTAYWLAQSRREIGLRLALGATPRHVSRTSTLRGTRLAALGIAGGLVLALAGNRLMAHLLFGVAPTDPAVLGTAGAVLAGAGFVACWLPSRRASRIDPAEMLRRD